MPKRVVKAEVYDKTHLHTEEGEYLVVNLGFYESLEGWWWWELRKEGRTLTPSKVLKCEL